MASIARLPSLSRQTCGVIYNNASKRLSSHFVYKADDKAPVAGPTSKMNMFQAINNAMDIAMAKDDSSIVFGEDVAFGGVFRCSLNLQVRIQPIY